MGTVLFSILKRVLRATGESTTHSGRNPAPQVQQQETPARSSLASVRCSSRWLRNAPRGQGPFTFDCLSLSYTRFGSPQIPRAALHHRAAAASLLLCSRHKTGGVWGKAPSSEAVGFWFAWSRAGKAPCGFGRSPRQRLQTNQRTRKRSPIGLRKTKAMCPLTAWLYTQLSEQLYVFAYPSPFFLLFYRAVWWSARLVAVQAAGSPAE